MSNPKTDSKNMVQQLWTAIELLEKERQEMVIIPMTLAEAQQVLRAMRYARDAATLPDEARWVGDRISLRLFQRGAIKEREQL